MNKNGELYSKKYSILAELYELAKERIADKNIKNLTLIGPFDELNKIHLSIKIYNNQIYFGLLKKDEYNNLKLYFTESADKLLNITEHCRDRMDGNINYWTKEYQKFPETKIFPKIHKAWERFEKVLDKIQQVKKEISLYNDKSQEMANADLYMDEYIDYLINLYEDNDLLGLKIELSKEPEFYKMLPRVLEQDLKGIDIANNDKDRER